MRSEGWFVRVSVCLSVCPRLFSHYRLRGGLGAIPTALAVHGLEIEIGDFAETTAFESDKLARLRTTLRGPTHQYAVRMHILLDAINEVGWLTST